MRGFGKFDTIFYVLGADRLAGLRLCSKSPKTRKLEDGTNYDSQEACMDKGKLESGSKLLIRLFLQPEANQTCL